MPKRPTFTPIETPDGWMVSVPPSMSGNNRRERKFFDKPTDAERYAKRLRGDYANGMRGNVIESSLARQAADAARVLAPYGITLMDAANLAVRHHLATKNSETFGDRYRAFVAENESHWRDRYALDMGKVERWVGTDFMSLPLPDITDERIDAALRANGADAASTVRSRRVMVRAVVNAKEKNRRKTDTYIMTHRECAKMIRACRDRAEVRAVALLLFAGIRPNKEFGELGRLNWSDVGKERITIHPEVSKTDSDRFIPITPRLARLLRGHPKEGTVVPPNWPRRIQAIRAAAGIAGKQDAPRHTYASHHLVEFGEMATKQAIGHTAGSTTLFKHYARAVTPEAGKLYFR